MTPEQKKEFLDLIPTAELYEEFKRRFEHCLVAGLAKRPTEDDPEHYIFSFTYAGVPLICQGLAIQLISRCQHDITQSAEEMPIDEL